MPEEANKLIIENMNKNIVDQDEYPAAAIIHSRCISMRKTYILDLKWVRPDNFPSWGSVEGPEGREGYWHRHGWLLRGRHAGWPSHEKALARSEKSGR